MKIRPQIPLRFRDEDQFKLVRVFANELGVSMNEWVLKQIEEVLRPRDVAVEWEEPIGDKPGKGKLRVSELADYPSGEAVERLLADDGALVERVSVSGGSKGFFAAHASIPGHDARTCRTYKCGLCAAMKAGNEK